MGQLIAELFEVDAPDQFHGDVIDAFGFAEVIGLDDVGVDQVGDQFRFADEILDEGLLVGVALANDFDRHALDEVSRAVLFRFINNAHAALKNFANDLVAELRLNREQAAHASMLWQTCIKSSLRSAQAIFRQPPFSRFRKITGRETPREASGDDGPGEKSNDFPRGKRDFSPCTELVNRFNTRKSDDS